LVTNFNEGRVPIFLISLKAGGTGLNLTGADIVIHFDPWWNLAAQNQATDRAHRLGQIHSVQVYKLVADNTIEERILRLQTAKGNLADSVISENALVLGGMDEAELRELLGS
ncbi:MAG: SWF/SNF helicase family protein, partial [Firmicutes bacterium]|nr:SWF/SNF helicase family protein [Bacillota bacterium]